MRIAFVFPNYWPYVRRGAERLMAEYAHYLVGAGHTVDIITSKPGPAKVVREGNLTVFYDEQITHPVLANYVPFLRFYTFTASAVRHMMCTDYDVAHAWLYNYGLGLQIARHFRNTPYLYHNMAEAVAWPTNMERWVAARVVGGADEVAALTPRAAANVAREIGVPVSVIPPCVDMDTFAPVAPRDTERPRVLFVSDLYAFRKGLALLFLAWDEVHRRRPEAILSLASPLGNGRLGVAGTWDPMAAMQDLVRNDDARAAIELLGEGRAEDLPRLYSQASVTVLPSIRDVFGLVLVESLACGTPVVGSAFEGPGDVITDPAIGITVPIQELADFYDPSLAAELAQAILDAMDLAADPATAGRCREHARQWSRTTIGPELERTYTRMIEKRDHPVRATV